MATEMAASCSPPLREQAHEAAMWWWLPPGRLAAVLPRRSGRLGDFRLDGKEVRRARPGGARVAVRRRRGPPSASG